MNSETKKKIVVSAFKGVVILVAGMSTASVATAVIKNNISLDGLSRYNKAMIVLGTAILGGVAGDAGANYAGGIGLAVEETVQHIKKMIEEMDTIKNQENEEIVPT